MEFKVEHVSKAYKSKEVIKDISMVFESGVIGLLGPNGAGKTTLMRMIATVEKPSTGTMYYNGENIIESPNDFRQVLGYLPQNFGVYPNLNAIEFLEYIAALKGLSMKLAKKRIIELLEFFHLVENIKLPLGAYSGGMKQRIGIIQALLNNPQVLIVDEPTVGLDPEERIQFRNFLSSLSKERIIILSTHIVSDIELLATKIAILTSGALIKFTDPEKMISEVEGMVWKGVVAKNEFFELQKKYLISNSIQRSNGIHLRIISKEMPTMNSINIEPTLEDSYLYIANKEKLYG